MQNVPLQAAPSQTFSVSLANDQWTITLKDLNGTVGATLIRNGTVVVTNARVVGGMRIIPSVYEESGNFVLVTQNYQLPDYTMFGTSQQLIYVTTEELELIRTRPSLPLSPDDFDVNAALPLRFFPQDYTLAP